MNVSHISLLRESYLMESKRPDGRKSTVGEYMRFITDNNLEFVTSKDMIFTDDENSLLHSVCINEDMVSQADFPVKIISAAYEDIHAIEAVMSRENFKKLIKEGYLSNLASASKKEFMINWVDNIRIQAQHPMEPVPYYGQDADIVPKTNVRLLRDDGITVPNKPATLASRFLCATSDELSLLNAIANKKEEIILTSDITLEEKPLEFDHDVKIDLGGHTLTSADKARAIVVNSGNVTISNGTIIAKGNDALYLNGIIKDGGNAPSVTLMEDVKVIADDCAVLLKGPGATLNTYGYLESVGTGYAAIQGNGSHGGITVNIYGGSIIAKAEGVYFPSKTELNIYAGTIEGSSAIYHKSGKLNICGGVFIANGDKREYVHNPNGCNSTGDTIVIEACNYPDGVPVVKIEDGEFISYNANNIGYYQQSDEYKLENTKFISGGLFNTDISEYVVEDMYAELVGSLYEIKSIDPNNISSGAELKAAIAAASDIKLASDVTVNSSIIIDKDINIDLNGKQLTVNDGSADSNAIAIGAKNNAKVVITGNGTINAGSGNSANIAVYASGATIDIMGGTFINGLDNNGNQSDLIYAGAGGVVNIYDGVFESEGVGEKWILNLKDNTNSHINVYGGSFKNFNPAEAYTEPEKPYNFVASGYYSIKEGDYYIVKKAQTVESINVVAGEHISVDTTIAIGSTNGTNTYALYAEGENAILDITGGYYDSGMGASNVAVVAKNGATVNISDGRFVSRYDENGHGNSCVEANGATINISGGYFECTTPYDNKYWVLNKKDNTGAIINVTGGTFVNFDPSSGNTENPNESFVAEGYHVEVNGNEYTVVPN